MSAPTQDKALDTPLASGSRPGIIQRLAEQAVRFKRVLIVVAGVGTVLSGLAGYFNTYQTVKSGMSAPKSPPGVASSGAGLSVVILPFSPLSADPDQAYFADGLTAELTADLSRITGAVVIASTTALTLKEKPVGLLQVGKELGVRYVLEGTVQRSVDKVRINARLGDAVSGAHLWAETFDGESSDLFALQDQVTARVANSIGRELVVIAARESESRKMNPSAVDLMMRGIALANRPNSLERLQQQEQAFRQVLVLDPGNIDAMARLSRALVLQKLFFGTLLPADIADVKLQEGYRYAGQVKELDPNNSRAELSLGLYALVHGDFTEALRAFGAGIALDRNNALFAVSLANTYVLMGEHAKALPYADLAIRLDPRGQGRFGAMYHAGLANFFLGNNDLAIDWFLKSRAGNPNQPRAYAGLVVAYASKGDTPKARESVSQLLQLVPKYSMSQSAEHPFPSSTSAYKQQYDSVYLPAARAAGLPE